MNSKTLEALKGSIKKWQRIVSGTARDEGAINCPLCWKFLDNRKFQISLVLDVQSTRKQD